MSLFKKRKNLNIRQRRTGEDEEEENNDSSMVYNNTTLTLLQKKQKKKKEKNDKKLSGPNISLSFGDELEADDGIIFQEKKSSLSCKLRKEMKKERKEKKKEEKEKLRVIEGKDKVKEKNGRTDQLEMDDLGIKIVNGREAEVIAIQPGDSDTEDENGAEGEGKHQFKLRRKSYKQTLDPWKKMLESGKIPDANVIHLIRKKRQLAREKGDIISVDDTVRFEDQKSRLIREDENDRSDDEGTRLDFSVDLKATDRKQRKEAFDAAQDGSDESDHDNEWEQQQLKKGGARTKLYTGDNENNIEGLIGSESVAVGSSYTSINEKAWGTAAETLIPSCSSALPRPTNYQAEGIIKRLRDSRTSLNEVHRRHEVEATAILDDLVSCKAAVASCQTEKSPLTDTFQFYQDMRGYVTDLRECLNEKVAEISSLEQQVYFLYRQHAQKLIQRRRQDVKDQNDEFSPFAGKAPLGGEQRVRRAAEREGRRTRRRREREKKGDDKHHNGTSTDDEESRSDHQMMKATLEKISEDSQQIFADVEDDFADVKRVMTLFERWRTEDFPTYSDAYVSYNLPKLFAPFIRLQMVLWNPLAKDGDSLEIERMKWYNQLVLYAIDGSDDANKLKVDPDRKLMSHVVEKVILVKLREIINCSWDPLSHVQTVRLVNLVRHYTETYPSLTASSKPLKELTLSIITKIRDSIDNDVFIPMFPKIIYENKTSGVSLFFQRQFWVAWKLLSSVLMWHKVLSDSVINDLAIRSLLNLYLLPALTLAAEINMSDALEKCRNVINALPRAWSKNEGSSHAFLGRLESILVVLSTKVEPSKNAFHLKEICELLKSIGSKNQAEVIINKYF